MIIVLRLNQYEKLQSELIRKNENGVITVNK